MTKYFYLCPNYNSDEMNRTVAKITSLPGTIIHWLVIPLFSIVFCLYYRPHIVFDFLSMANASFSFNTTILFCIILVTLDSLYPTANSYFNLWCGQTWRNINDTQKEIFKQIINYIVSNGTCTIKDIREWDRTCAAQLIQAFGGNPEVVNESLASLSQFLIYRKTA